MNRRKKYKFKKSNPPFRWPLILLIFIFVEFVVLIQERAWSQNYIVVIDRLRDQADNISFANQKLFKNLSNYYDYILKNQDNNYLTKAEREFLNLDKSISLLSNEE